MYEYVCNTGVWVVSGAFEWASTPPIFLTQQNGTRGSREEASRQSSQLTVQGIKVQVHERFHHIVPNVRTASFFFATFSTFRTNGIDLAPSGNECLGLNHGHHGRSSGVLTKRTTKTAIQQRWQRRRVGLRAHSSTPSTSFRQEKCWLSGIGQRCVQASILSTTATTTTIDVDRWLPGGGAQRGRRRLLSTIGERCNAILLLATSSAWEHSNQQPLERLLNQSEQPETGPVPFDATIVLQILGEETGWQWRCLNGRMLTAWKNQWIRSLIRRIFELCTRILVKPINLDQHRNSRQLFFVSNTSTYFETKKNCTNYIPFFQKQITKRFETNRTFRSFDRAIVIKKKTWAIRFVDDECLKRIH